MRLKNKVAIVTGAASGIGKVIAEKFAHEGAKVVVADLDGNKAEIAAKALQKNKHEAMAVGMDVTNEEQVEFGDSKSHFSLWRRWVSCSPKSRTLSSNFKGEIAHNNPNT